MSMIRQYQIYLPEGWPDKIRRAAKKDHRTTSGWVTARLYEWRTKRSRSLRDVEGPYPERLSLRLPDELIQDPDRMRAILGRCL